ncbi:hypothetical protein QE375_003564 [Microbacterium foliorum]|uniref:Benenodin family lasso peptide n=1 Tax=Microbacterium foliorum TaxID=104336 RepID=A0ABU1HVD4_9MICO|nr:hypothetical protein [Microbacterium foliorum]
MSLKPNEESRLPDTQISQDAISIDTGTVRSAATGLTDDGVQSGGALYP